MGFDNMSNTRSSTPLLSRSSKTDNTLKSPSGISLPIEIILRVIEIVSIYRCGALRNFQTVSKELYTIVTPFLYRYIHFNQTSLPAFVNLLGELRQSPLTYSQFFSPPPLRNSRTISPEHGDLGPFLNPDLPRGHRIRTNFSYVTKLKITYDMPMMTNKPFRLLIGKMKTKNNTPYLFPSLKALILEGTKEKPLVLDPHGIWFILPDICSPTYGCIRDCKVDAREWSQSRVKWQDTRFTLHENSIHLVPPGRDSLPCTVSLSSSPMDLCISDTETEGDTTYRNRKKEKFEYLVMRLIYVILPPRHIPTLTKYEDPWQLIIHSSPRLKTQSEGGMGMTKQVQEERAETVKILKTMLRWTKCYTDLIYHLETNENEIVLWIHNKSLDEYGLNPVAVLKKPSQEDKFRYLRIKWIMGDDVDKEPPCQACGGECDR